MIRGKAALLSKYKWPCFFDMVGVIVCLMGFAVVGDLELLGNSSSKVVHGEAVVG